MVKYLFVVVAVDVYLGYLFIYVVCVCVGGRMYIYIIVISNSFYIVYLFRIFLT